MDGAATNISVDKILFIQTLPQVEYFHGLYSLLYLIGLDPSAHLDTIEKGPGNYFFPGNELKKQKRAMINSI